MENQNPIRLPEDLLKKILDSAANTVKELNKMYKDQMPLIEKFMKNMRSESDIIQVLKHRDCNKSVIAVDGGNIIEKQAGTDVLLAVAVAAEGFYERSSQQEDQLIEDNMKKYDCWNAIMSHDEASSRLCQGIMFLMELNTIASEDLKYDIKIIDGTHFTPILKINSLLSAHEESTSTSDEYEKCLKKFLKDKYEKTIPDIPDMIKKVLTDKSIIAMPKYTSSQDIIKFYSKEGINVDDKTLFTLKLNANEYTKPLSVGQSEDERRKIWDDLHIKCNILSDKTEQEELNKILKGILNTVKTKDSDNKTRKESELFFSYYKPFENHTAYRIEFKKSILENNRDFEDILLTIKKQICHPHIQEPFPQYLADMMVKSISSGFPALKDSIMLSKNLKIPLEIKKLIYHSYRSN